MKYYVAAKIFVTDELVHVDTKLNDEKVFAPLNFVTLTKCESVPENFVKLFSTDDAEECNDFYISVKVMYRALKNVELTLV